MFHNIPIGTHVKYMLPCPDADYEIVCVVTANDGQGEIIIRLIDDFNAPDDSWFERAGSEYSVTPSDIYLIAKKS